MSIASEITRLQTAKAGLKTSIEAKGVTVPSSAKLDAYSALVDSIPSGGSSVEEKLVNFIDYEGTLVASYTGVEIQALAELPASPNHSADEVPLTFDGWNWTLAQIKAYNTSYPEAKIWVGATYHTTDGKIHLFFRITTDYDGNGVQFHVNASGTVDWGDGGAVESFSSGNVGHIYSLEGLYHCVVSSIATSCSIGSSSDSNAKYYSKIRHVFLPNTITIIESNAFQNCYTLQSITIPNSVTTINTNAFTQAYSLQSITIPNSVTTIGGYMVRICYSIKAISIPYGITNIGNSAFSGCYALQSITIPDSVTSISDELVSNGYALQSITIPDSVTSIGNYLFAGCRSLQSIKISNSLTNIRKEIVNGCYALQSITIPDSVTSIGTDAFNNCYSLYSVTIEATTPPTLANVNAFNTTYTKKIYVPANVVEDYKSASNWSNFASIIEAISA